MNKGREGREVKLSPLVFLSDIYPLAAFSTLPYPLILYFKMAPKHFTNQNNKLTFSARSPQNMPALQATENVVTDSVLTCYCTVSFRITTCK